jgi:hypothetical protein
VEEIESGGRYSQLGRQQLFLNGVTNREDVLMPDVFGSYRREIIEE